MTKSTASALLFFTAMTLAVAVRAQTQQPDISTATPAFTVIGVNITAADITQDKISVQVGPAPLAGTLTLRLVGTNVTDTILNAAPRTPGNLTESFNTANRAAGEYTQIQAVWTVGTSSASATFSYHIQVLGVYLHTQYNTPHEDTCAATPTSSVYLTNAQCSFASTDTVRSQFLSQTNLNGFGISIAHGSVQAEQFCVNPAQNPGNIPADANGRSLRVGPTQTGSCFGHTGVLNDATVAANTNNPFVHCGDKVFINTQGVKTVTDSCPACSDNNFHHLDNFTTNGACSGITSLGNLMTIKLFQ